MGTRVLVVWARKMRVLLIAVGRVGGRSYNAQYILCVRARVHARRRRAYNVANRVTRTAQYVMRWRAGLGR